MSETILASDVFELIRKKFSIPRSSIPVIVYDYGAFLIKIFLYRNKSRRKRGYHFHSFSPKRIREWIVLEGFVTEKGNDIARSGTLTKRVMIWKNEEVPRRIVESKVKKVIDEVNFIKTGLENDLNDLKVSKSRIEEFEKYLKDKYKGCEVTVSNKEEAHLEYKSFELRINSKEEILNIYLKDKFFTWDLPIIMQGVTISKEEKRFPRLFRISKRIPKNEETKGGL